MRSLWIVVIMLCVVAVVLALVAHATNSPRLNSMAICALSAATMILAAKGA